jgi:hypothetical protein
MADKQEIKWFKVRNCHYYHAVATSSDLTLCGRAYGFKDRLCRKCCKKLEKLRDSEENNN